MVSMISSSKLTAHHIGIIYPQDPVMSTVGLICPEDPTQTACAAHSHWPHEKQLLENLSSIGLRVLIVLDARWTRELPLFP